MTRRCGSCGRRSSCYPIQRFGGGNYRRAGRWIAGSICAECVEALLSRVQPHHEAHGGAQTSRYSVLSLRQLQRLIRRERIVWQTRNVATAVQFPASTYAASPWPRAHAFGLRGTEPTYPYGYGGEHCELCGDYHPDIPNCLDPRLDEERDAVLGPRGDLPRRALTVDHDCAACRRAAGNDELIAGHCVDIDGDYWHVCGAVLAAAAATVVVTPHPERPRA